MDKKAWIAVILCGIALIWQQMSMSKRHAAYRAEMAAKAEADAQLAEASGIITPEGTSIDGTPVPSSAAANVAGSKVADAPPAAPSTPEQTATITNGDVEFVFSSNGGGISRVDLYKHHAAEGLEGHIVLNDEGKAPILTIGQGTRDPIPTQFQITESSPSRVVMEGELAPGVSLRKAFTLSQGDDADPHVLDVQVNLKNNTATPIDLADYYAYLGAASPLQKTEWIRPAMFWQDNGDAEKREVTKFDGSKLLFRSPQSEIIEGVGQADWAGVRNQYYTIILSPKAADSARIWSRRFVSSLAQREGVQDTGKSAPWAIEGGLSLGDHRLEPGASRTVDYDLYAGPKEYRRLTSLDKDRGNAMFYGFFSPISKTLMWLMTKIHDFVPSWGWSIVLMTLIIRTVIWPLHSMSQKTMKRMSLLQPKMAELKEKYADDPQKMQVETMTLYKTYGVNPMGGCIPVLFQIPIFFGFYRMLQSAAELRGADWFWAEDLSMPDTVVEVAGFPLNPLPLLMGATMFLQMAIAPKTGDALQRKIFMFMPLMFLVFCYNFASALALYWTTQNIFSIFQTWLMRRQPDPVLEKATAVGIGGSGKKKKKAKGLGGLSLAAPEEDGKKKKKKRGPRTGG